MAHGMRRKFSGFTCDCEPLRFCRGKANRDLSEELGCHRGGFCSLLTRFMSKSARPVLFSKLLHFGFDEVRRKCEITDFGFNLVTKLPPLLAQLNKESSLLFDGLLLLRLVMFIAIARPSLVLSLLWRRRLLLRGVELLWLGF